MRAIRWVAVPLLWAGGIAVALGGDLAAAQARLDAVVAAAMSAHQLPSVTLAIATRAGVVWQGAYGEADLDSHRAARVTDLYGIGSITKTFVACLVERRIDRGEFDEATPLATLLPGEVLHGIANADTVTIGQLLRHTGGVPSWEFEPQWIRHGRGEAQQPDHQWGKTEALDYLRSPGHPATAAAGAAYAYSNTHFTLLGLLLERLGGRDVTVQLHEELLDPLGLTDIRMEGFEAEDGARMPSRYHYDTPLFRRDAGVSPYYRVRADGLLDVTASNLSTEWTAGGLVASVHDLAAFTADLRDGRVVSAGALQRMVEFHPTDEADEQAGAGIFREQVADDWMIGYDGGVLGFGAVMGWLEHGDVVIALATNVGMMHTGDDTFYPLQLVRTRDFIEAVRAVAAAASP